MADRQEEELLKLEWGHGPGTCGIDGGRTGDGVKVFTCGTDGAVKVFDAVAGTEVKPPKLELDVEINAVALAPSGDELMIGTQDGYVKLYSLPDFTFRDNVTRFTAPVRDVCYSPDGGTLAACSDEPGVRIVRRSRLEKSMVLKGHGGGAVRGLSWDSGGEFLASCGFDGSVIIWAAAKDLDDLLWDKVFDEVVMGRDVPDKSWNNAGRMSWRPNNGNGSCLAVPGEASVALLSREGTANSNNSSSKWSKAFVEPASVLLNHSAAAGGVCAVVWSPDGKWIASAGMDKKIIIWDPATYEPKRTLLNETCNLAGMTWLQQDSSKTTDEANSDKGSSSKDLDALDTLAVLGVDGSWGFLPQASPREPTKGPNLEGGSTRAEKENELERKRLQGASDVAAGNRYGGGGGGGSGGSGSGGAKRRLQKTGGSKGDDDDDDLFEKTEPTASFKRPATTSPSTKTAAAAGRGGAKAGSGGGGRYGGGGGRALLDDEAEDAGDHSDTESVRHETRGRYAAGGEDLDRTLEADEAAAANYGNDNENDKRGILDMGTYYPPPPKAMAMQEAFMPSATPAGSRRRFLCWNGCGSVTMVDEGTHNNIEVEPADLQSARMARFQDSWGFEMGAMAEDGAFFATKGEKDDDDVIDVDGTAAGGAGGRRSVLLYKSLRRNNSAGGAAAQWTKMLPAAELSEAVAAGHGWAAVATGKRLVRVFTSTGFQAEVFALPGPVVCMAGDGPLLLAVYHSGPPMEDCQSLEMLVVNVSARREVSTTRLCVTPEATLTWAGFADGGMPAVMDSAGVLWGLTAALGLRWAPLLDTKEGRKNKTDVCWPVAVQTWRLACAVLKGGETHPATNPKPVLTALELTGPACPGSRNESKESLKFERLWLPLAARVAQLEMNAAADGGVDELLEQEIVAQQAALDTALLKALKGACASGQTDKALDVAIRLALPKSFQIALNICNHLGLTQLARRVERVMLSRLSAAQEGASSQQLQDDGENGSGFGYHNNGGGGGGNAYDDDSSEPTSARNSYANPLARAARAIEERRPLRAAVNATAASADETAAAASAVATAASSAAAAADNAADNSISVGDLRVGAEAEEQGQSSGEVVNDSEETADFGNGEAGTGEDVSTHANQEVDGGGAAAMATEEMEDNDAREEESVRTFGGDGSDGFTQKDFTQQQQQQQSSGGEFSEYSEKMQSPAPKHGGGDDATTPASVWTGVVNDDDSDPTTPEMASSQPVAPKVPFNPFARGSKPPTPKASASPGSLLQSFAAMSSPSPLGKRSHASTTASNSNSNNGVGQSGQKLGRSSSFAAEARSKSKRSKNVL